MHIQKKTNKQITIRRQIKRRKAASIQRHKHFCIRTTYSVQLPKFHLNLFFNEMHNEHANRTQNVSGSNDKCVFSTHTKSNPKTRDEVNTKRNAKKKKKSAKNEYQKSHAHTTFSPYAKHNVGLQSIFGMVTISKIFLFQLNLFHSHRQF